MKQLHYEDMIFADKYSEVELELRKIVDEMMRHELELLQVRTYKLLLFLLLSSVSQNSKILSTISISRSLLTKIVQQKARKLKKEEKKLDELERKARKRRKRI